MSKQLTLSSTLAIFAMAGLALLTSLHGQMGLDDPARTASAAHVEVQASAS